VDVRDGVAYAVLVGRPQVAVGGEGFGGVGVSERRLHRLLHPAAMSTDATWWRRSWKLTVFGSPASARAREMTWANVVRRHGSPFDVVKTRPVGPAGYSTRCAASTSTVTCASGTVRFDGAVFGGPNADSPVSGVTIWRSTRTVRRRKSTRSTCGTGASRHTSRLTTTLRRPKMWSTWGRTVPGRAGEAGETPWL
jgi:hypothetical protein